MSFAQVSHHVNHTCATQTTPRGSAANSRGHTPQQSPRTKTPGKDTSPFSSPRSSKGAMIIIRFNASYIQSFKNSMTKSRSIMRNYGGSLLGVGSKIYSIEGNWNPQKYCVGVLHFANRQQADLWYVSDPLIKQQDWLDGADFICVPLYTAAPLDKCVFEIMDLKMSNPKAFFEEYIPNTTDSMVAHGATPCVAATEEHSRIASDYRGLWEPGMVIVHCWPSLQAFRQSYDSEEYQYWKNFRQTCTCTECDVVVFQGETFPF
ncbi:unnamed protein product [Owenia fusiformis]|uniref:DUF1330 domain-containing protein n=1 Tax=Owenia fusiformis TaxID=6347 RepID=A0A8S4NJR6_OWEFU|nr:unnamed protein product [Owenia fusiformis]